jgi:predicted phosphodiesterase
MRILLVSDIHSNLVALETVIADAGSFDKIWCLGDVVGYGPQPNECIDHLRRANAPVVAGNHDWAVLDKFDVDDFNPDARLAALWTRNQLSVVSLDWLHSLVERAPAQLDIYTLVHGSPRSPVYEYVLTPTTARENLGYFDTPVCFVGHTHLPAVFRFEEKSDSATQWHLEEQVPLFLGSPRMMINPGSVGQPRDGDPRSAYAILDTDASTLTHHRVAYDIKATQKQMERAHLPPRLTQRLDFGR